MLNNFVSKLKPALNSIVKLSLEIFIFDKKIRRVLKGKFCQWFLTPDIREVEGHKTEPSQNKDKTYRLWQYWDGGLANAPEIVKACISSVEKFKGDLEHVVLNNDTIKNYVEIPSFIYELKEKGIISKAHFADILRTWLLYEHGGCWIDSTVYLTAPLPEYIQWSELFVFQNKQKNDADNLKMTNYFMSSKGNSIIIAKMKKFLENYWSKNYFVINYFFYAHAFTLLANSSEENRKEWDKMFYSSYIPVQIMEKELLNTYSAERFEELKKISPIHKLSYKWKVLAGKKKNIALKGTLYEYIIAYALKS